MSHSSFPSVVESAAVCQCHKSGGIIQFDITGSYLYFYLVETYQNGDGCCASVVVLGGTYLVLIDSNIIFFFLLYATEL